MAGQPKPVRCVETGQVFSSGKEAAAYMGLRAGGISRVVTGVSGTCGGYHWEYVKVEKDEVELPPPKVEKPRSKPGMSIYEVQEEARRRTQETGRYVRYAHIQKEETLRMLRQAEERRKK